MLGFCADSTDVLLMVPIKQTWKLTAPYIKLDIWSFESPRPRESHDVGMIVLLSENGKSMRESISDRRTDKSFLHHTSYALANNLEIDWAGPVNASCAVSGTDDGDFLNRLPLPVGDQACSQISHQSFIFIITRCPRMFGHARANRLQIWTI